MPRSRQDGETLTFIPQGLTEHLLCAGRGGLGVGEGEPQAARTPPGPSRDSLLRGSRQGQGSKCAPWYPVEVSAVRISEASEGRKQSGKGLVGTDQEILCSGASEQSAERSKGRPGRNGPGRGTRQAVGTEAQKRERAWFCGESGLLVWLEWMSREERESGAQLVGSERSAAAAGGRGAPGVHSEREGCLLGLFPRKTGAESCSPLHPAARWGQTGAAP